MVVRISLFLVPSFRRRSSSILRSTPPLLAPLPDLLLERLPLPSHQLHHLVRHCIPPPTLPFHPFHLLPYPLHFQQHRRQLIRQPRHNRTPPRCRRVRRPFQDILPRKAPMPPPKLADLIQHPEPQPPGPRHLFVSLPFQAQHPPLQPNVQTRIPHPFKKLAVVLGPIRPEIVQDLCQRRFWKRQRHEVVEQRDDGVVGAGFAAVRDTFPRAAVNRL